MFAFSNKSIFLVKKKLFEKKQSIFQYTLFFLTSFLAYDPLNAKANESIYGSSYNDNNGAYYPYQKNIYNPKSNISRSYPAKKETLKQNYKKNQNIFFSIKAGVSKKDIYFDLLEGKSNFEWNKELTEIGCDLELQMSPSTKFALDYSHGKAQDGSSSYSDSNGDYYNYLNGLDGKSDDVRLRFSHKIFDLNKFSISPVIGGLYTNIRSSISNNEEGEIKTNSKYYALMVGLDNEFRSDSGNKINLIANFLTSSRYKSHQSGYIVNSDKNWILENSRENTEDDWGVSIRGEYSHKLGNNVFKYVKIYSIFEYMEFDGLTQKKSNELAVGGTGDVIRGEAKYKSLSAGITFTF
jgi:hypothetical protein